MKTYWKEIQNLPKGPKGEVKEFDNTNIWWRAFLLKNYPDFFVEVGVEKKETAEGDLIRCPVMCDVDVGILEVRIPYEDGTNDFVEITQCLNNSNFVGFEYASNSYQLFYDLMQYHTIVGQGVISKTAQRSSIGAGTSKIERPVAAWFRKEVSK